MFIRAEVSLAGERSVQQRRSGLLIALLALGISLLVLAPLTLISLRRDALLLRNGPVVTLEVVADGMRFVPSEIRVPVGGQVHIDLVNQDPAGTPHDLQTFQQQQDTRVIAWPGERRSTWFIAADKPGRYAFVCTLRGHSAAGMAGTIVVEGGPP